MGGVRRQGDADEHRLLRQADGEEGEEPPALREVARHLRVPPVLPLPELPFFAPKVGVRQPRGPRPHQAEHDRRARWRVRGERVELVQVAVLQRVNGVGVLVETPILLTHQLLQV